jgi:hypothetical protein
MLVYLFQGGNVQFIAQGKMNKKEVFNFIKEVKNSLTPSTLVGSHEKLRSACLLNFVSDIFKLEYDETPSYTRLKMLLVQELQNKNHKFDYQFEWNKSYFKKLGNNTPDYRNYYLE